MTIFLFANMIVSGPSIFVQVDLQSRHFCYISALSLMAVGVRVSVWPYAFFDTRASPYTAAFWETAATLSRALELVYPFSLVQATV